MLRLAASNTTRASFSQKNNAYPSGFFRNNFEEITNASLFLLKQWKVNFIVLNVFSAPRMLRDLEIKLLLIILNEFSHEVK